MARSLHIATIVGIFLAIACCVFLSTPGVESSHFQYGTYEWDVPTAQANINLLITQAWRYKFFWNNNGWANANGLTKSVGTLYFSRLNPTSSTSLAINKSKSLVLTVTGAWSDPTTSNDGYWYGQYSGVLSNTAGLFSGTGVWNGASSNYLLYFNTCCRVGTLLDGNAGKGNQVTTWIMPARRNFSLVVQGFPREFIEQGVEMYPTYQLRSANRDEPTQPLRYTWSPLGSGIGGSTLTAQRPGVWGPKQQLMTLDESNNRMMWVPLIIINGGSGNNRCKSEYCPYAMSLTLSDYSYTRADGTINPTASQNEVGTRRIATQIDWIIIVIRPCTSNCPPRFQTMDTDFTTVATVPNIISFDITDGSSNQQISLENTPPPSDLTWTTTHTASGNTSKLTVRLVHDADVDGANSALICFSAVNNKGLTAIGNFCPKFVVIKPNFMFVTGIIREFENSNAANGMNSKDAPWPSTLKVSPTLDTTTRLPTLLTSSIPTGSKITNPVFDLWWNDQSSTALATATMVSYYNAARDPDIALDAAAYAKLVAAKQEYLEPGRRMYTFRRPFWQPTTVQFYTYELHTTFDLLTSEVNAATALKFGVTGGELFVYIDNVLVVSLSNADQKSPLPSNLLAAPVSRNFTYTQIRDIIDADKPAPKPARSQGPETYNIDIFYTHRRERDDGPDYTGFQMEFGSSSQCSAITVLRSPQWQYLVDASIVFDYTNASTLPSGKTRFDMTKFFQSNSNTALVSNAVRLLPNNVYGSAASFFYNSSLLKVLNGFEARFSFTATAGTPGLAFVIQSQSPSAKGSEGAGLGYAGITNAIAVEFDMLGSDAVDSGYNFQHISVHKSSNDNPRVSASETPDSWPLGSTPIGNIPNLPFGFSNGTKHDIKVEFIPTATAYWMYVYVNENIKALYTAQFSRADLDEWYKDGAYIGFSTSNYGTAANAGQVLITDFAMTVIPPLAQRSGPDDSATSYRGIAGELLTAKIQLRDACGSKLLARGEADRFIARLVHRDSKKPFTTTNSVSDIPIVKITDEDNGLYSFSATPTRSGDYQFYIYYREADMIAGEGQPVGFAQQDYSNAVYGGKRVPKFENGVGEKSYPASVAATSADPNASFFFYPGIAPGIDNAAPSDGAGVSCTKVPLDISVGSSVPVFTLILDAAEYNTFSSSTNDLTICVVRGYSTSSVAVITAAMTKLTGVQNKPAAADLVNGNVFSAAWVHSPTAADSRLIWSNLEHVSTSFTLPADVEIYVESWAPTRIRSTTVGRGVVLLKPARLIAETNATGSYYLYAKDRYGNSLNDMGEVSFSFTPSLETAEPAPISGTPFTLLQFTTARSSRFSFSTFFLDNPVQIRSSGVLIVNAGKAHYSQSLQSGISVGGTVNSPMSFTIALKDSAANQILAQTQQVNDKVYIRWVDTEDSSRIFNPILLDWDTFDQELYHVTYTPQFAGTFYVQVFINPPTGDNYNLAYEMTDSKGKIVSITAGPVATESTVGELNDNGVIVARSTTYGAGEVYQFQVQTKDQYENSRYTTYDGAKAIKLSLALTQGGAPLTEAVFKEYVDTTASTTYTNGNNYLSGSYSGTGIYRFGVVFKKTAPTMWVTFRLDDGVNIGNPITAVGPNTSGDAEWQVSITPGELSENSIVGAWCPTATASNIDATPVTPAAGSFCADQSLYRVGKEAYFAIQPLDRYSNPIAPSAADITAVKNALQMTFESTSGAYQYITDFAIIGPSSTNTHYIGSFTPVRAGTYSMQAQLRSNAIALVSSPAVTALKLGVLPHATNMKTLYTQWPTAAIVAEPAELLFVDIDQHTDERNSALPNAMSFIPETQFEIYTLRSDNTCTPFSTQGSPACVAEPGRPNYKCTFEPTGAGKVTYYLAAIGGSSISTDTTGATVVCATPTGTACPSQDCIVSATLQIVSDGKTSAFIGGIARVDGAGADIDAVQLLPDATTDVKLDTVFTNNQGIRAGSPFAIFVFQKQDATLWSDFDSMDSLSLRLTPEAGSKFKQLALDTTDPTITLVECPASGTGICAGRSRAAYYRIVISEQIILGENENNNFSIWHVEKSSIVKSYSYTLRPAPFDPVRSTITRQTNAEIIAGESWTIIFTPYDIYNNLITKQADYLNWPPVGALLDRTMNKITGTDDNGKLVPGAPSIGFVFTDRVGSTAGFITATVSGHYFTTAALSPYYAEVRPTASTPNPTDPLSIVLGRALQTGVIKANQVYLPNSAISLLASPDVNQQVASWANFAPVANKLFTVYILPKDMFNNPTVPKRDASSGVVSLKAIAGDRFTAVGAITIAPQGSTWDWVVSPFSSTNSVIYQVSAQVNKNTRNGFKIVAETSITKYRPTDTASLTEAQRRTPESTFFARSAPLAAQTAVATPTADAKLSLFGDNTFAPLVVNAANEHVLTIDSTFKFTLRLKDSNNLAYIQSIGASATNDNSNVSLSLSTIQPVEGSTTGEKAVKAIAATLVQQTQTTAGVTYAVPGQFTLETVSLSYIGLYDLIINVVDTEGTKRALMFTFRMNPGKPFIDYTQVSMEPLSTGKTGEFKFTLYDRLQNVITQDYRPPTPTNPTTAFFPPAQNTVIPSIHLGSVNCFDVHESSNPNSLQYALTPVRPSQYPNYKLAFAGFDPADGVYSMQITPVPSGLYTFNVTFIGQSLITAESWFSCGSLIPLSFQVETGPPSAQQSYYTVTPLGNNNQPTSWGAQGKDIGYAGQAYQVDLSMIDQDGNQSDKTTQVKLFYSPSETLDSNSDLYHEVSSDGTIVNSNILSIDTDIDLTESFGRGYHRFVFRPKVAKAGYNFKVYMCEPDLENDSCTWKRITGVIPVSADTGVTVRTPSTSVFTVLHGSPASIQVSNLAGLDSPLIAGAATEFTVIANDLYGNPITTNTLSKLQITIFRDSSVFTDPIVPITGLTWVIPDSSISTTAQGVTTVKYTPSWEGNYSVQIVMTNLAGTSTLASTVAPVPGEGTIEVLHAACAGRYIADNNGSTGLDSIFMCASTGECVEQITECSAQDQVICPVGTTRLSATSAECVPYDQVGGAVTYVKCPDGTFVSDKALCPPTLACPSGTQQCSSDQTQCRSQLSDCPSASACPAGTVICPNQLSCAASLSACPTVPTASITSCQASGKVMCATGQCVAAVSDCPTKPSCSGTQVLCLTDGSCQDNALQCPQIPPDQVLTTDKCRSELGSSGLLCPTGDKCVVSLNNCPSAVTCPVGQVLCAVDNTCKKTLAECYVQTPPAEGSIYPDATVATCATTEFRCPSGECVQNLMLCSSQVTCPSSSPVLCSDKTCKTSLALCTLPPTCATGTRACPATGLCVSSFDQCSVPLACPASASVLCANSSCVASIDQCTEPVVCPPALPYTCPTSGVCRASLNDCPSLPHCPTTKPFVCDDLSCSLSPNMCLAASSGSGSGTPGTSDSCATGLVRCSSGECSTNPLTCPSQVTCTPGTSRCSDGSCRVDCSAAQPNTCSDRGLVACPQSASGMSCASRLSDCPQGFTCPLNKPVRCQDATCALSASDCPFTEQQPPSERTPCSDGSWVIGSQADCPTAVTCPPTAPIKCYDQTCQKTLEQCPVAQQCDLESTTPFRCATGTCATTLWDCLPVDPTICASTVPIKCPSSGGNVCVASLSKCPTNTSSSGGATGGDIDTTIIPDPVEQYTSSCTSGYTLCRDGSCQETPNSCPVATCPVAFSFLCPDGSCAKNSSQCPSISGCPWDLPVRCSGVGNCVATLALCSRPNCEDGTTPCSDGTCALNVAECPAANGCRTGQQRCSDGSCVAESALCSSQSNANFVNSCPPGAPFKCPNGLCVVSSFACPAIDTSSTVSGCSGAKPVLCADGLCRQSTELCPIIKPCQLDTERCDDGFCRNLIANPKACPNVSNCPLGQIRCKQSDFPGVAILDGICAPPGECRAINGCPINAGGVALFRCTDNGRCVEDSAVCNQNIRLTNGCLAQTPIKCWNGDCAATAQACPANNNCPAATPVRCPSGECVAAGINNADPCTGAQLEVCSKVACADGSCKDKASECITSFGCPVTTPIRCADGQCRALPASYRPFLSNELANTLTCPPVISCPSSNYYMCESGACVLAKENCPSIAYTCSGSSAFRCLDSTCRPSEAECGKVEDSENPGQWIPSSSKPATCPQTLPVMCDNGACVSDIANCDRNTNPETTTITGSPSSSQPDVTTFQVLCQDGSYRNSYAECRKFAEEVNAEVATANPALLCIDYCANGRCVLEGQTVADVCAVVPACSVGQYRCFDGSCRSSCDGIEQPAACPDGQVLNIDGRCRSPEASLGYDGCYHNVHERFVCYNRECAANDAGCLARETRDNDYQQKWILDLSEWGEDNNAANGKPQPLKAIVLAEVPNSFIAELLADTTETDATTEDETPAHPAVSKSCQSNCVSQQKATPTSLAYSPLTASQSFPIGPLSTGLTLQLSSGLVVDDAFDTTLYIHPVAESLYYNATNKIVYSRLSEFGGSDAFTAAQTVLSPAFSCSVGAGLQEPFAINIGVSSLIDRNMNPAPLPRDVCLARLRRFPKFGYATWQCLFTDEQRDSGDLQYAVRQSSSQLLRQAISTIPQCYDEDLSVIITDDGAVTGEFNLLQQEEETTKVPAVYAFIHSPVSNGQVYLPAKDTFWRDNIIWLLFVIIGAICVVFFLIYAILRLSRYSNKTDKIKDEIQRTEAEVQEMEQFGDKRRDVEVGYVANPLAVSLDQQKELEETTNEEKIARKRQLLAAQQADSVERQEVINALDNETAAALERLEQLRKLKGGAK